MQDFSRNDCLKRKDAIKSRRLRYYLKNNRTMATIVLQVPDETLVAKVKQACKMLMGVTSVKVQKEPKEEEFDITKTADFREALEDVKHGRVTTVDSVDDMFKQILGYVPDKVL